MQAQNTNQSLLQELQALKMQAKAMAVGIEILEKKLAKEDWPKESPAQAQIAAMIAKRQNYYQKKAK